MAKPRAEGEEILDSLHSLSEQLVEAGIDQRVCSGHFTLFLGVEICEPLHLLGGQLVEAWDEHCSRHQALLSRQGDEQIFKLAG